MWRGRTWVRFVIRAADAADAADASDVFALMKLKMSNKIWIKFAFVVGMNIVLRYYQLWNALENHHHCQTGTCESVTFGL